VDDAETTAAIIIEIQKAMADLGASPVLAYRAETMTPPAVCEELKRLGADPYLLAIVGSWQDTMSDEEVLDMLRDWNAGSFDFDVLAGTGRVAEIRAELPPRRKSKLH
jgi:hypothetical protein